MPQKFSPAPEVACVAAPIIREHHYHLIKHDCRIEYLFCDQQQKVGGAAVWASARKITSLAAYLAGEAEEGAEPVGEPFFVITVHKTTWGAITESMRIALIDHELCHCWADYDDKGNTRLQILPRDLEEFGAVYARHGAWSRALRDFLKAGGQEPLDLDGESIPVEATLLTGADRKLLTAAPPRQIGAMPKALPAPPAADDEDGESGEAGDDDIVDAEFTEITEIEIDPTAGADGEDGQTLADAAADASSEVEGEVAA